MIFKVCKKCGVTTDYNHDNCILCNRKLIYASGIPPNRYVEITKEEADRSNE